MNEKEIDEIDKLIHNSIIELMNKHLKYRYKDENNPSTPKDWESLPTFLWHNYVDNKGIWKNNHHISEGDLRSHLFYILGTKKLNGTKLINVPPKCKTCFLHAEVGILNKDNYIDLVVTDPWNRNFQNNNNGFIIRGIEIKLDSYGVYRKGRNDLEKLKILEKDFSNEYNYPPKSYWLVFLGGNLNIIKSNENLEYDKEPNDHTKEMLKLVKRYRSLNVQLYFIDEYDEKIYKYNKEMKNPIIAKKL